jgi:hypothetical protein
VADRRHRLAGGALLLLVACEGGYLPLRGKFDVGREPMIVFVGGPATASDLYAVSPTGGKPIPITFSAFSEMRPALSPSGEAVAYLRAPKLGSTAPGTVWMLSFSTGSERSILLPPGADPAERVGWTPDGRSLVVESGRTFYRVDASERVMHARAVTGAERAVAESALAVLLGRPVFGQVVPCFNPEDLCVVGPDRTPSVLARGARDPARWGDDSVAYLEGDRLVVRPVGPGHPRSVNWTGVPERPRQLSVFPGPTSEPR